MKKKNKKRQTEEEVGRLHVYMYVKEWTGMNIASSTRAAENRTRCKGIVANSFVELRRSPKVMG